jgi:hypothetical protein
VLKSGGERALTRQTAVDDGFPKYHMPLEEANKLIEANLKIINGSTSLGVCDASVDPLPKVAVEPSLAKRREGRPKVGTAKSRLGRIMHKLYDLELECVPEKPLNVDLGVDLYQMEDY